MDKIGVFLVDSQAIFRQGVRSVLAQMEDIEMIGEADISEGILPLIEAFAPQVVLLDVGLPSLAWLHLTRRITQRFPGIIVIILTPYEDDDQLFQAIKGGAVGYLSKNIAVEELAEAIRKAAGGEPIINEVLISRPRVAQRVLKEFQDLSLAGNLMETLTVPLTSREVEILKYIALGNGNKQIAHALSISEQTIKNHVTAILRKLDANDRTHAVVVALRNGWISL